MRVYKYVLLLPRCQPPERASELGGARRLRSRALRPGDVSAVSCLLVQPQLRLRGPLPVCRCEDQVTTSIVPDTSVGLCLQLLGRGEDLS